MKKFIALALVLALMLCGCGASKPAETVPPTTVAETTVPETTEAPATEPTTVPTTEPIVYTNPLNGQVIDAPFTGRIFANTISNIPASLPHVGVNQADILMEMFVNNSNVRCLAVFSDVSDVPSIGSTRSTRLMFNDLAEHYDMILCHAYGSPLVIKDANARGIDHINLDQWSDSNTYSFRDQDRRKKLGLEHSLMGIGPGILAHAEAEGMAVTRPEGKDYGFTFTENGTPEGGETADVVNITLRYKGHNKPTVMKYDAELQKYVYNQYNKEMVDGATGEKEAFTNVLVVFASIDAVAGNGATYQRADFLAGGGGYFACGGQIIPVTWTCDGDDQPFRFFLENGEPLNLGVGNTYMAICTPESPVTWTAGE